VTPRAQPSRTLASWHPCRAECSGAPVRLGLLPISRRTIYSPSGRSRPRTARLRRSRHPTSWADEAFRRQWRVGGADPQDLRHQGRIVGNPVSHDDAPGPSHAHHRLGHLEWLRREHRAENAQHEVETVVRQLPQIAGVAFLKPAILEAFRRASVARRDKVAGDVDAQHLRAQSCRG
jgi:hypothetical protein